MERVYAPLPYNVELSSQEGKVYAHITWSEELPPLAVTKENGVLALDVNSDPYHLALAVVAPDGNLKRHLTLSLEEVDRAPNPWGEGARLVEGGPPGGGGGSKNTVWPSLPRG